MVFSAPAWCGPCRKLAPQLNTLKNRLNIPIVYVDIDKAESIKNQHQVMSVPSIYVFENGKPSRSISGRNVLQIERELAAE